MSLGAAGILSALVSHAQASGLFDNVLTHEPKSAPGGTTAAFWINTLEPTGSGLASTTVRLEVAARLYVPMLTEPQDDIELTLLGALDYLMGAYTGDFELGGTVQTVDLLGAWGTALKADTGYVRIDSTLYRSADITVPLIITDLWTQGA